MTCMPLRRYARGGPALAEVALQPSRRFPRHMTPRNREATPRSVEAAILRTTTLTRTCSGRSRKRCWDRRPPMETPPFRFLPRSPMEKGFRRMILMSTAGAVIAKTLLTKVIREAMIQSFLVVPPRAPRDETDTTGTLIGLLIRRVVQCVVELNSIKLPPAELTMRKLGGPPAHWSGFMPTRSARWYRAGTARDTSWSLATSSADGSSPSP